LKFRIAPIFALIVLSPPVSAQEPDAKCRAEQLEAKLSSGVIPDMVGCPLKPTLVVLKRYRHVPAIARVSGPPPTGNIVSQTPAADTRRLSDTPIELNYSDGNAAAPDFVPEPVPNLSVSVRAEPSAPYQRGAVVKFSIVVHNNGDVPIPFARVTMELDNLSIVSVNPTFADACHELPCDLREIPPGAYASMFVRALIGDEKSFRTVITATPSPPDAATADNSVIIEGEVESPVAASADISVAIASDSGAAHKPDAAVTYLITIHNAGPQAATNVKIELAEQNLSLEEVTGACSKFPCSIPSIAPDGDASMQVRARAGTAGNFRSLVHTSSENDPDESNNARSYDGVIVSAAPPRDPDSSNNGATFPGEDEPPSPEIPWIWIIVSVFAVIGAGVATHSIRKARWSRMIKVNARIDPRRKNSIDPIEPVKPLEIRMRVEQGETKSSPIDVREA
jgi:hypothetical protein